ncbi:MAG: GYD domain-containing protein [Fuerstiella sp.]
MQRYVVLLKFTDTGIRDVDDSPARAKRFTAQAEKAGVEIKSVLWTMGEFDGLLQFKAADEQTAVALVLSLHKADNVHTRMLRAFDSDEFTEILGKIPS